VVASIVLSPQNQNVCGDAAAERGHKPILSISELSNKKDNKTAHGNKAGARVGGFQFSVSSL
jgi:hypothetical protein